MGVDGPIRLSVVMGEGAAAEAPYKAHTGLIVQLCWGPLRLAQREGPRQGSSRWSRLAISRGRRTACQPD